MFRYVTGAQEAVVHRQSEDSLLNENNHKKSIKDIQSDDISQKYTVLKTKWFHEREKLKENLKYLQKHNNGFSHEIQRIKNLIDCLNQLIENGEVTKHCQILINEMKQTIQPQADTYIFTKKPLGDKIIRLPRHISKTTTEISKILPIDDEEETTPSSLSTERKASGIQFYVMAEQFRNEIKRKPSLSDI